ncbi:hypothetical protein Taro_040504 [Colocasia esculenta]|uniref:Ubiquitin-like protease family profile domain-containing protein n=1 Tax=Colocasia esculenta TaxID=4460 RepID=A0A843WUR9_COLES|nr:hypothetical protein [Colocasia esculenta]
MASSCSIGSIPLLLPKVPQQRDGEECGVFALYYIYLFLMSAPATFSFTEYPYFMTTTWFSYLEIDAFEHKIRNFADLSLNDPHVMPCENVELEDESDSTIKVNDVGIKRKGRGPTMCHDVHALEEGKKNCVEWDAVGQPVGKGGKSLRTFLGTMARNADKCPINVASWDKMPRNCIEDVWEFIQRKYDIPNEDLYRGWVMKDLSFKWKFHKYDLRRKYLKQDKKGIQIKPPSRYHIHEDMWTEAVKVWTSSAFRKEKTGTDPDRADIFIITHTRKDGRPINEDCAIAILTGKKVKLLDLENEQVAEGIVMSIDPNKIVMGRPIGHVPQQTNGTECGFFILYYIYHFIKNDPPSFSLDNYPSFFSSAPLSNYMYSDINKKRKSHHKYFHYAGTKSFADINEEEIKLQDVKITQPSSSCSSAIATADDIYSQVFKKGRPGRVRRVGTSPTPTSLWGTSSQCQAQLTAENAHLNAMVKQLAERLGKVESIVVEFELDGT